MQNVSFQIDDPGSAFLNEIIIYILYVGILQVGKRLQLNLCNSNWKPRPSIKLFWLPGLYISLLTTLISCYDKRYDNTGSADTGEVELRTRPVISIKQK